MSTADRAQAASSIGEEAPSLEWDGAPSEVQNRGPAFHARTHLVDRAFAALRPARMIDIGCGRGYVTHVAARHAGYVVAMDLSPEAADETRVRLQDHARARVAAGDPLLGKWGLLQNEADEAFDAVLLSEVLEHIEDDDAALTGCHRLLADRGHLVLTVPGDPSLWTQWDDLAGHIRRYERAELITKLESAGFRVVKLTNWGFPLSGWLAVRGARMRGRRVSEQYEGGEVPGLVRALLPLASVLFKLAARIEPVFSFLDRGAGYVVVAEKVDGEASK